MDVFFERLGRTVLERWEREGFSLSSFPAIACAALAERSPVDHLDVAAFVREFLLNDAQASQTQSGFGQPELVVYEHARFYIQVLFWLDGTTDIHQHAFSGAFQVLVGSSIHTQFEFANARAVTPHFFLGDMRLQAIELLETGRTVPIESGQGFIHALFHLDTPSVTVVVRTHHDLGPGPQLNYLPPAVAYDPSHHDALMVRRTQLLDVLEQIADPAYPELVLAMLAELDFARGLTVLQHGMRHLRDLDAWDLVLAAFQDRHGSLAAGIAATFGAVERRDIVVGLRSVVEDPEHRFFLALLLNVPTQTALLALVTQRFPEHPAHATVARWMAELAATLDDDELTRLREAFADSSLSDLLRIVRPPRA
jgi:hypothetical protein